MNREPPTLDSVLKCVPRMDGGFLVVGKSGNSAASTVALPTGARIRIERGRAVRV